MLDEYERRGSDPIQPAINQGRHNRLGLTMDSGPDAARGRDPLELRLVDSFNRPGGNITGVFLFAQAVEAKKLELLGKLVPPNITIAYLFNPKNPVDARPIRLARSAVSIDC